MAIPIPFATGFYMSPSLPIAAQECVNFYVNIPQTNAISDAQLLGRPGISLIGTAGSNANRGSIKMDGIGYHVNGESLYSQDANDTLTSLGTIPGQNYVSMASNGTKLCIVVPGGNAYVYATATGLNQITDPDLPTADTVVYKDGFYIFTDSSGKDWRVSNLNQPGVLTATDFGSAEADPDPIVAGWVSSDELYICGSETVQLFQSVGGTGFPFQAILGSTIHKGVTARASLVNLDGGFAFIGGGKGEKAAVWMVSGGSEFKISTTAIDHAIQAYTEAEIAQATAWTYSARGEQFVAFNLPQNTFTYQVMASRQTERHVWVEDGSGAGSTMTRSRIASLIKLNGELVVADTKGGNIGKLDYGVFTDYGETFRSTFSTQTLGADGESYLATMIEATCESGVGSATEDPLITKEQSNDAKTWTGGVSRGLGKQGEFKRRQIWPRLGLVSRFRVYRFYITDAVKRAVLKLEVEVG